MFLNDRGIFLIGLEECCLPTVTKPSKKLDTNASKKQHQKKNIINNFHKVFHDTFYAKTMEQQVIYS